MMQTAAERLFESYLNELESDAPPAFEDWVSAHPDQAEGLRLMWADWRRAGDALAGQES